MGEAGLGLVRLAPFESRTPTGCRVAGIDARRERGHNNRPGESYGGWEWLAEWCERGSSATATRS